MKPSTIRTRAAVATFAVAAAVLAVAPAADAAIIPTVLLGTAGEYSVLAGQTVTNTNASVLNLSLGVHPGSAVVGFPPGLVNAPGTIHAADAPALQAKSDLTAAYVDAAARPVDQTGPNDLTGLNLQAGVYAASSKGPLLLTGNVILDGAGDPSSVFIFQTDSTLITGAGSTVSLINGAQQCNIFWQIGSSATLGTGSDFTGNILASASVTVENSVTVHGRALAQTGSVTLDLDTFVAPTCDTTTPVVTVPAAPVAGIGDTVPGGGEVTVPGLGDTLLNDTTLPRTGRSNTTTLLLAAVTLGIGAAVVRVARRKPASRS
jgi:LPXTG-motif cell wall-anchored protein